MTEKRASTGGGLAAPKERAAGESVARLSDHLGRLLAHADKLLAEWQAHADGVKARLDEQGARSGEVLARALDAALADVGHQATVQMTRVLGANAEKLAADIERARQAAADLEAHMRRIAGGAGPTSIDELRSGLAAIRSQLAASSSTRRSAALSMSIVASLLAAAALLVVLLRPVPAPAPAPAPVPAPVAAAMVPDAAAPAVIAPPPPPPCTAMRVEPPPTTAPKLVLACQTQLCGTGRKLADCTRDDPAGADLIAALRVLARERSIEKLTCAPPKPDADQRSDVTVRWILECATRK